MGKLDRLCNRVETLLLHWLGSWHCTCQHRILPNITVGRAQSMSLYGHRWFKSLRRRFAPPLSYLGMSFIYGWGVREECYPTHSPIKPLAESNQVEGGPPT